VPEIKKIIEQKPNPLPAVKRKRFSWEQGQEQVPARSPHEDAHIVCEGSAFNFFVFHISSLCGLVKKNCLPSPLALKKIYNHVSVCSKSKGKQLRCELLCLVNQEKTAVLIAQLICVHAGPRCVRRGQQRQRGVGGPGGQKAEGGSPLQPFAVCLLR